MAVGIPRQSAVGVRSNRSSQLMERYASGDDAVFDQLYQLLAPRLYRFCVRLARVAPEADDIFQETFLKLHRARATYLTGADPIPWAFAIARSVYLSRLRYRRRHRDEVGATADVAEGDGPAPSHATPEAEILAEHMLDVVIDELDRMSEKNRVAYVLLKEENLSVKDAAAVLGTNCDVVKQRAHRAYEQLKAALDAAGWREYGSCAT
jgi:RNA polymerase sigma-70 factor, ECF subfamily